MNKQTFIANTTILDENGNEINSNNIANNGNNETHLTNEEKIDNLKQLFEPRTKKQDLDYGKMLEEKKNELKENMNLNGEISSINGAMMVKTTKELKEITKKNKDTIPEGQMMINLDTDKNHGDNLLNDKYIDEENNSN